MKSMVTRSEVVKDWIESGGLLTPVGSNSVPRMTPNQPVKDLGTDSEPNSAPRTSEKQSKQSMQPRTTTDYLLRLSERSDEQQTDESEKERESAQPEASLQHYKEPRVLRPGEGTAKIGAIDGCISELESWVQHKKLSKLKQKYAVSDEALFEIQEND